MLGSTSGDSPICQLCGKPQTKNINTNFNDCLFEIMNKAIAAIRNKGFNVVFLYSSVDGVSCDSKRVQLRFLSFLRGCTNYSVYTDTNHKIKNER